MADTLPLISVIVPVYKVENYLDKCVQSIVDQTYTNLEIILVDDGSPDNCGAMCDAWAAKDSRIRVIHKENGGQAEARNVGIEAASGEWIGFVDSDDYICNSMYEALMGVIQQHRANAAACKASLFSDDAPPVFEQENATVLVFEQDDAVEDLIREVHFSSTVWNLLVEAPVAKMVPFDVGKIHEDILWPYRVFAKCQKIVHTSAQYYAYYQRQGSTMNSGYSEKRFDALDALQERAKEVKKQFPSLYPLAERAYMGACLYHYQMVARLPDSDKHKSFKVTLHKRFCCCDRKAAYSATTIKYKLWYTLFAAFPALTCRLRNALKIGV